MRILLYQYARPVGKDTLVDFVHERRIWLGLIALSYFLRICYFLVALGSLPGRLNSCLDGFVCATLAPHSTTLIASLT